MVCFALSKYFQMPDVNDLSGFVPNVIDGSKVICEPVVSPETVQPAGVQIRSLTLEIFAGPLSGIQFDFLGRYDGPARCARSARKRKAPFAFAPRSAASRFRVVGECAG
jgi:hypothetical protein